MGDGEGDAWSDSGRASAPARLLRLAAVIAIAMAVLGLVAGVVGVAVGGALVGVAGWNGGNVADVLPSMVVSVAQLGVGFLLSLATAAGGVVMLHGANNVRADGNRDVVRIAAVVAVMQPLLLGGASCCGGCGACGAVMGLPLSCVGLVAGVLLLLSVNDERAWHGMRGVDDPPEF